MCNPGAFVRGEEAGGGGGVMDEEKGDDAEEDCGETFEDEAGEGGVLV